MKLLNNETGKEVILQRRNDGRVFKDYNIFINIYDGSVDLLIKDLGSEIQNRYHYKSFEMFRLEWKEYEESDDFWYIDDYDIMCGSVGEKRDLDYCVFTNKQVEKLKQIGNYFETEEEAEKAVEKLKAWTRLKDKGFKFTGYYLGLGGNYSIKFETGIKCDVKDLDLLFGGEDA